MFLLHHRIEEASLNAWPALRQMIYDGWLLRFADGYTKRANSVTPLSPSNIDLHTKIAFCEQTYKRNGLACIFRLQSFAAPELDQFLAQRGYALVDPTLVLSRHLRTFSCKDDPPGRLYNDQNYLRNEPLDRWLATFCRLSAMTLDRHATHRLILERIIGQRMLNTLLVNDGAVACGMAVVEDDLVGLFDIVTAPEQRRRSYGTQLIGGMLAQAQACGATYAYLQVTEANTAARRLYDRLGFQELYRYWYRVAPAA